MDRSDPLQRMAKAHRNRHPLVDPSPNNGLGRKSPELFSYNFSHSFSVTLLLLFQRWINLCLEPNDTQWRTLLSTTHRESNLRIEAVAPTPHCAKSVALAAE